MCNGVEEDKNCVARRMKLRETEEGTKNPLVWKHRFLRGSGFSHGTPRNANKRIL